MDRTDPRLDLVKKSALFRKLPEALHRQIAEIASIKNYQDGDIVVREGLDSGALYEIVKGSVEVSTVKQDGTDLPLKVLRMGACFGEVGYLSGRTATATIVAQENLCLISYPHNELKELIPENSPFTSILESLTIRRAEDTIHKTLM